MQEILKLPKNYTSLKVGDKYEFRDSHGNVIYDSKLDSTSQRLKVWDHYYKEMGTSFVQFYELEKTDNKQLIHILIAIGVINLVFQVISFIQRSQLIDFLGY